VRVERLFHVERVGLLIVRDEGCFFSYAFDAAFILGVRSKAIGYGCRLT
jgi:hypothetical protein